MQAGVGYFRAPAAYLKMPDHHVAVVSFKVRTEIAKLMQDSRATTMNAFATHAVGVRDVPAKVDIKVICQHYRDLARTIIEMLLNALKSMMP